MTASNGAEKVVVITGACPKLSILRQEEIQESPWLRGTLDQLAEEVGMSRAGLARRFKELVGSPVYDTSPNCAYRKHENYW